MLAAAMLADSGLLAGRRKLNISQCCKAQSLRIGEAQNPGPRGRQIFAREGRLGDIETLEPATILLRGRLWTAFLTWFEEHFPGHDLLEWMSSSLELFISVLVGFGHDSFASGKPLYGYRQLVAHCQKEFPALRGRLHSAWEVVSRWEIAEPTRHRPPLPEPILEALASLGIAWGWPRWTAVLLAAFYGISRVGELLKARRRDVLTPKDLLTEDAVIYVKIALPKSRRRGPTIQYITIDFGPVVSFLEAVWDPLSAKDFLYPGTPSAFRTRWDKGLAQLGVRKEFKLTPGSLRPGGAVRAHRKGTSIQDLLWKMRLQHLKTLSYYPQEMTAVSVLPALPERTRTKIAVLQGALPIFICNEIKARSAQRAMEKFIFPD
jgi:hypothetical protein